MNNKLPDRIAFIADAHLGMPGDNPERSEKITAFLIWLKGKISHLYIVGDLFDFWFEYKTVVPNTSPKIIFELYNLVHSGTEVIILAGNHDYWLGKYISNDVGLRIALNELIVEHQNKKIYIHHGDGLYPHDHGYRILKKVLRNKISISLFRIIHPDIASWIARITSKTSRYYIAPPVVSEKRITLFRPIADKRLKEGFDAAVYGHSHVPLIEKRENGNLILLGDWIKHSTYVFLENGNFTLHNWEQ
ncbi:UDP-2,3-diacylglucosamine diphosphatase [Candidatus Latescibacterota bacterium]